MRNFKITQSLTNRSDASLGLLFKEVSKIPMIDINQEIELCHKIKEGDINARNKLVESNLRFVISVAKQYQGKGLPLVDLIQVGVIGMLEAANKWDESRGFKFISYAIWWIRQAIIKAISSECRTIRVPMNQIINMNKINKATDKLSQEYERDPSYNEIANEVNLSSNKVALTLTSINRSLSLNKVFDDSESSTLCDIIPDQNAIDSDKNLMDESISKEIERVLHKIPARESDVVRLYYGIGIEPMTLDEIGEHFGIGFERVRQVLKFALDRIKERFGDKLKELL